MMRTMLFLMLLGAVNAHADMAAIDDKDLSGVTGQSGVYLSGEMAINQSGGPLMDSYFGSCNDSVCGGRIAAQTQLGGGWFVIDNIRGTLAFEGLTMQLRTINSGFGGDGALFNRDVLEIGMPESLRMSGFQFTLASSNTSRPSEPGFNQVDMFSVEMSGEVTLEGNLLVFPTP